MNNISVGFNNSLIKDIQKTRDAINLILSSQPLTADISKIKDETHSMLGINLTKICCKPLTGNILKAREGLLGANLTGKPLATDISKARDGLLGMNLTRTPLAADISKARDGLLEMNLTRTPLAADISKARDCLLGMNLTRTPLAADISKARDSLFGTNLAGKPQATINTVPSINTDSNSNEIKESVISFAEQEIENALQYLDEENSKQISQSKTFLIELRQHLDKHKYAYLCAIVGQICLAVFTQLLVYLTQVPEKRIQSETNAIAQKDIEVRQNEIEQEKNKKAEKLTEAAEDLYEVIVLMLDEAKNYEAQPQQQEKIIE